MEKGGKFCLSHMSHHLAKITAKIIFLNFALTAAHMQLTGGG